MTAGTPAARRRTDTVVDQMRANRRTAAPRTILAVVLALLFAGCGGDGDAGTDGTLSPDPAQTGSDDTSSDKPATDDEDTADPGRDEPGEDPATTDGSDGSDPDEQAVAGTPVDMFWQVGDVLVVVGVAADDVLNVRATPGTAADVAGSFGPLEDAVEVVGETRMLPGSWWLEVAADGTRGWVNVRHLAFVGATSDETSRIRPSLPDGGRAASMQALAEAIAETETAGQTEPGLRVVVVDGPSVGDLAEITFDVLGVADDAVLGGRYHVFAEPPGADGEVELRSIEVTALCARGATAEGACV